MEPSLPHRKLIHHYEGLGHLRELTFSTYLRMPLLTSNPWRKVLSRELDDACEAERFELIAFVYMPEHVHLLVLPLLPSCKVSRFLGRVKQQMSVKVKKLLVEHHSSLLAKLTIRDRPEQTCFRFWQEGPGFDRNLYSPRAIAASIDYIHNNPVKRDLCRRAIDWRWSSARLFEEGP